MSDQWNNVPADTVQRYVKSMIRPLVACIDANGSHIPFWSDTVDCHTMTSPYVYHLRKWRALIGAFTSGRLNVIFTHFWFGPLPWSWRSNFRNKRSNIMKLYMHTQKWLFNTWYNFGTNRFIQNEINLISWLVQFLLPFSIVCKNFKEISMIEICSLNVGSVILYIWYHIVKGKKITCPGASDK